MSFGLSAGTSSRTLVISGIFVSAGGVSASSTTTPTRDFLRNGTRTREPGCTCAPRASGMEYVNVLRSGTGSGTLQKEADMPGVVEEQREGREKYTGRKTFSG